MAPCRASSEDKYLARLALGLAENLFSFRLVYSAHYFLPLWISLYRNCAHTSCVGDNMREVVALALAAGAAASPFDKNKWHFEKKPHGWYVQEACYCFVGRWGSRAWLFQCH